MSPDGESHGSILADAAAPAGGADRPRSRRGRRQAVDMSQPTGLGVPAPRRTTAAALDDEQAPAETAAPRRAVPALPMPTSSQRMAPIGHRSNRIARWWPNDSFVALRTRDADNAVMAMRGEVQQMQRAIADDLPSDTVVVIDVDTSIDGDAAVVLSHLGSHRDPLLWLSFCERFGGTWRELVGTEAGDAGSNWAANRWIAYASGRAPAGARAFRATLGGVSRVRAVRDGYFLVAFFGLPGMDLGGPGPAPAVEWLDHAIP
ncbi:MAG: hypothetical protein QOJ82_2502 [Solirubrobacteraceae bacterium]|nr:hypothetical protein [Solirubrobacteraceae bacterium]